MIKISRSLNNRYLNLIKNFKKSTNRQKILANTIWLLADKVGRLITSLFVGIWIARYLGPEQFGSLNYVIAMVGLFTPLLHLGLNNIIVKEIVRSIDERYSILGTALTMQLVGGALMSVLSLGSIALLKPDDIEVRTLAYLVTAAQFVTIFYVIDLWYQSQVQSKYSVLAKSVAFVVIPFLKIGLILSSAPLISFAGVMLLENALNVFGLILLYIFSKEHFLEWRFQLSIAKQLMKECWPLLISSFSIVVYMKIDQILLQVMVGDKELGLYSAAIRISEMWYFVPVMIMSSTMPLIITYKNHSEKKYYLRLGQIFQLMTLLSVTYAIILTLFNKQIILLLYGPKFMDSGAILAIHSWAGIPVAIGTATGVWLVCERLTLISLQKTLFGALINVGLNLWLIPQLQGIGAAIATVIAYTCATYVWHVADKRTRQIGLMQITAFVPRW